MATINIIVFIYTVNNILLNDLRYFERIFKKMMKILGPHSNTYSIKKKVLDRYISRS